MEVSVSQFQQVVVFVEAADGSEAGSFGEVDGVVCLVALHPATAEEDGGIVVNGDVVPRGPKIRDGSVGT